MSIDHGDDGNFLSVFGDPERIFGTEIIPTVNAKDLQKVKSTDQAQKDFSIEFKSTIQSIYH